jgi:hypothetical protein
LKYKLPKQTESPPNHAVVAILVAKAFDPVGGVCLKYETNRAVEVGRLISGFQELGQLMQNVPRTLKRKGEEETKGEPMVVEESVQNKVEVPVKSEGNAMSTSNQGSGGKKKKKGKR